MSLLFSLFGPSQSEVWSELAHQLGGAFHRGGLLAKTAVQVEVDDWIITLDSYQVSHGNHSSTYTRLRAPYVNPEGFTFQIYRSDVFSGLARALGMQDIPVGDARFDSEFVIKGNSAARVRRLFANDRIRELISRQPKIKLEVRDDEGWFKAKFPAGVDELVFTSAGVIKSLGQLESLFALFAEVLRQICHDGAAYEDDVQLHIQRLRSPGGRIEGDFLLWEGDRPRREAVEALGRLGDPNAVPALASVLGDADEVVRAGAIDALARIGDEGAVGPLIPLLGDARVADGRSIRDRVADALRGLGREETVVAVLDAFEGRFDAIKAYSGPFLPDMIGALEAALAGPPSATNAARGLMHLRSVESLPALRAALRRTPTAGETGETILEAIEALEARSALPRPARRVEGGSPRTLPSPAAEPGTDTSGLPRPSSEE